MNEIDKDKLIEQLLERIQRLEAIIAEQSAKLEAQSEKIKLLEERVKKNRLFSILCW